MAIGTTVGTRLVWAYAVKCTHFGHIGGAAVARAGKQPFWHACRVLGSQRGLDGPCERPRTSKSPPAAKRVIFRETRRCAPACTCWQHRETRGMITADDLAHAGRLRCSSTDQPRADYRGRSLTSSAALLITGGLARSSRGTKKSRSSTPSIRYYRCRKRYHARTWDTPSTATREALYALAVDQVARPLRLETHQCGESRGCWEAVAPRPEASQSATPQRPL